MIFAGELKPWHRQRTLWEIVLALFSSARVALAIPIALDAYLAYPHVLVTQRGGVMERRVDDALAKIGHRRRIVLSTPHFLVVPHLLLETPLIATMHGRAARWLSGAFNLKTNPVAADVSSFQESARSRRPRSSATLVTMDDFELSTWPVILADKRNQGRFILECKAVGLFAPLHFARQFFSNGPGYPFPPSIDVIELPQPEFV